MPIKHPGAALAGLHELLARHGNQILNESATPEAFIVERLPEHAHHANQQ